MPVATAATVATPAMPVAASPASVPSAVAATIVVGPLLGSAFSAIEIWLRLRRTLVKISAAFDGHSAHGILRGIAAAHLGALLFENRLARKPDAVAFYGEHFHQHLVAFLQFIANIGNAVLGN